MRVKVTPENIDKYRLDLVTGNSKEDLLNAAIRASEFDKDVFVQLPDVEGGDTEAPTERNTFDHFSNLPQPEEVVHDQSSVNLGAVGATDLSPPEDEAVELVFRHSDGREEPWPPAVRLGMTYHGTVVAKNKRGHEL